MTVDYLAEDLKDRELEIIQLMAEGASNQQIAEKLYITTNTVRWYNKQIYGKFGVNSRIKVVNLAREWGLLADDDVAISSEPHDFSNLPAYTNTFIGREEDFAQVQKFLVTKRLLTLTGPAGIGKTRFAVQLARQVMDNYADGVCFVSLASLTEAYFVPTMVATQLHLAEDLQKPTAETVAEFLVERDFLLILDNFEHVMDAGVYVNEWLVKCPDLTILITSREVLHWQSEQVYRLNPLGYNFSSNESESEAVQLFIERSRRHQARLEFSPENTPIIRQICESLDGLPLAIELAAARSDLLTPQVILEQLTNRLQFLVDGPQDLPPRQRSLQSALAWSFDLLDEMEQILFRRLGIFRGGFTLESVEKICLDGIKLGVVDGLASLLRKSLIDVSEDVNGEPRFYMLEVTREYAYTKLLASGELAEIHAKFADYFAKLAKQSEQERHTQRAKYWVNHIQLEIENILSSLNYFGQTQQSASAMLLLANLTWSFIRTGYLKESIRWYEQYLDKDAPMDPAQKANVFLAYGYLLKQIGQEAQCIELQKLAYACHVAEQGDDKLILGRILGNLATHPELVLEDGRTAFELGLEARDYFHEVGAIPQISWIENILGELCMWHKDYAQAQVHYAQALEIAEELNDINRKAIILHCLGTVAILQKNFGQAFGMLTDALHHNKQSNNITTVHSIVIATANLLAEIGFYEQATQVWGIADHIKEEHNFVTYITDVPILEQTIHILQNQLDEDTIAQFKNKGLAIPLAEVVDYCLNILEDIQQHFK